MLGTGLLVGVESDVGGVGACGGKGGEQGLGGLCGAGVDSEDVGFVGDVRGGVCCGWC